jgi:hypothetical protein
MLAFASGCKRITAKITVACKLQEIIVASKSQANSKQLVSCKLLSQASCKLQTSQKADVIFGE